MTKQELQQYMQDKKKRNAKKWKEEVAIHGYCRPFTDKDYYSNRDIIFAGKSAYKIKFVHNTFYKITR